MQDEYFDELDINDGDDINEAPSLRKQGFLVQKQKNLPMEDDEFFYQDPEEEENKYETAIFDQEDSSRSQGSAFNEPPFQTQEKEEGAGLHTDHKKFKLGKFKNTTIHQVLFSMREQLSARDESKSYFGGSEETCNEPQQIFNIENGELAEMRSTEDLDTN